MSAYKNGGTNSGWLHETRQVHTALVVRTWKEKTPELLVTSLVACPPLEAPLPPDESERNMWHRTMGHVDKTFWSWSD